jgi:hypothetical protein
VLGRFGASQQARTIGSLLKRYSDIRENLKPVYADFKKEGLIADYKVWFNDTTDHPGDWDVAVGILFPNYAALDPALDSKAATIAAKHYGSRDAMIDAGKKRNEMREVVASKLAREVMPK